MKRVPKKISTDGRNQSSSQSWKSNAEQRCGFNGRYYGAAESDVNQWRSLPTRTMRPTNLNKALPSLPTSEDGELVVKSSPPLLCITPTLKSKQSKKKRQIAIPKRRFLRQKKDMFEVKPICEWSTGKPLQYVAVEKGVQTDPVIVVEKYPARGSTKGYSSIGPNVRPRVLRHASDAESDKGLTTPLWSPRLDVSVKQAQDYFVLSGNPEVEHSSLKRSEQFQLPPQHGILRTLGATERSNRLSSGYGKETSADTLGTYESRYSIRSSNSPEKLFKEHESFESHEAKSAVQGTDFSKPPLLRTCSSKDTVQIRPNLSRRRFISDGSETNKTDKAFNTLEEKPLPLDSNVRKARHNHKVTSLNHLAYQNRSHHSRSQSSEVTIEPKSRRGSSEEMMDLPTPDEDMNFYHVRLEAYPEDVPLPPWQDVPDHFLGSPLCPQHPKHKSGGLGICPMHGLKVNEPTKEETLSAIRGDLLPEADTPAATSGTMKEFVLGLSTHQKGDLTCPANIVQESGKYGVCPLHGRGKDRDANKLKRLL